MKKWTRMIAAASVLGLVLAGCDEKDNNDNPKVEINIKDYGRETGLCQQMPGGGQTSHTRSEFEGIWKK